MTRKIITRIAASFAAIIVLASCRVDTDITLAVKPNGTGTISVVITADKDIVAKAPGLKADVRTDDLVAAGWKVLGPTDTKDGGLSITLTHEFLGPAEATTLLGQLNGTRGPLHEMVITRTGKDTNSTYTLAGRLEVNGGLSAFADDATLNLLGSAPYAADVQAAGLDLGDAVGITFNTKLPGKVNSTTGQATDGVITWRVPMDGTPTSLATSVTNVDIASSISRFAKVLVRGLLYLWIIASVILILLVLRARNRRRPTPRI
ncbi:MAG: hypothetical protein JHC59_03865 [Ilumatobacteraceae bacterium]|nr:hypothetical protein [Ilumatobacteraceae bacterium]